MLTSTVAELTCPVHTAAADGLRHDISNDLLDSVEIDGATRTPEKVVRINSRAQWSDGTPIVGGFHT